MIDKKKKILKEELNRFRKILGYNYYSGDDKVEEGFSFITDDKEVFGGEDDLILGDEGLYEGDGEVDAELEDIEGEVDAEEPDMGGDEEMPPEDEMPPEEPESDVDLSTLDDEPLDSGEEEVELDVTDLVKGSEEAKESANAANEKIEQLMGMVGQLEAKLNSVSQISAKVESLENELEKRVPTPTEKIEMRSLSSYPYNIKLSDYWNDHEDQVIDLDGSGKPTPEKEYTLTRDDVNSEYNESQIKNSFYEEDMDEDEFI